MALTQVSIYKVAEMVRLIDEMLKMEPSINKKFLLGKDQAAECLQAKWFKKSERLSVLVSEAFGVENFFVIPGIVAQAMAEGRIVAPTPSASVSQKELARGGSGSAEVPQQSNPHPHEKN